MKDELKHYQVEPDNFWKSAPILGTGYDTMGLAKKLRWEAIDAWGKDGWNLGSWPYVMIYFRTTEASFDLAYYVEGDVTVYACPTVELRNAVCDELAFFHWKWHECRWVADYETVDDLPEELRGPYRR